MHKNFIELAEKFMEEARVCDNNKIVLKVASAVDAILAHFREEQKPPVRFELDVRPGDIVPGVKDIVATLAKAQQMQAVVNKLGSWASAAQDDPGCCAELKAIFLELLDLCGYPELEPVCPVADEQDRIDEKMGEYIDNVLNYDGPEMTALEVLQLLNKVHPLGDMVYDIREREAEGWEGPKVKQWGHACEQMQKQFKQAEEPVVLGHQHTPQPYEPSRVPEPVDNGMRPWPADWPAFYHRNEPCDMLIGPCSCGTWHSEGEFTLKYNPEGIPCVERHLLTRNLPPRNFERSNFER